MQIKLFDAQAQLGFLTNQAYVINARVYRTVFPELAFNELVFVDTSAPEWSLGATTFVGQGVGKAEWGSGYADDMPLADVERERSDVRFRFAHVGYEYNIEELGVAMQLGVPLQGDKALAARRAYQEFMWNVALFGASVKGMEGLANQAGAVSGLAPADGTGGVTTWFDAGGNATKTPTQIVRDFNGMLTGIFTGSMTTEMADTVLLPYQTIAFLAATPFSANSDTTLLEWLLANNIRTLQTGQRPMVRGVLGLETAGAGGTARAIAYRNAEDVAALHLPAAHRFEGPRPKGTYGWVVPGWFRTGGVELRRPYAFRYLDGI
jgi:hypothetical protein